MSAGFALRSLRVASRPAARHIESESPEHRREARQRHVSLHSRHAAGEHVQNLRQPRAGHKPHHGEYERLLHYYPHEKRVRKPYGFQGGVLGQMVGDVRVENLVDDDRPDEYGHRHRRAYHKAYRRALRPIVFLVFYKALFGHRANVARQNFFEPADHILRIRAAAELQHPHAVHSAGLRPHFGKGAQAREDVSGRRRKSRRS